MVKGIGFGILAVGLALAAAGCGGGGSSGGTSGTTSSSADSLSDLPSTSTLVKGGGTSTNLSAKSVSKAVTGTPPLLKDINSSNVDTYFWNGLIATLTNTSVGSITQAQRDAFWEGEGICRMAQAVGYAFQHISEGGASLCYMQNAPSAANGVSITSGDTTAAKIFDQTTTSKVIKVSVSSFSVSSSTSKASSSGPEEIFIKVYGTGTTEGSAGYAADLWFCSSSGTVNGYEQIRSNNTTKVIDLTSVHKEFGNFVGAISGYLTTDSSGQFVFDTSQSRTGTVYFGSSDGLVTFLGSVLIDSSTLLTARDFWSGTFNGQTTSNKHAVFANYDGESMDTLRFTDSSFALQDSFGSNQFSGVNAAEFNTSLYVDLDSGTLFDKATSEKFDEDIYKGTSSSQYSSAQTKISATSGFSCSTTADVTVAMDFSQSGPKAVQVKCEKIFKDMNFCDSSTLQTVREKIFQSQTSNSGSCSTAYCPYAIEGGVNTGTFACQLWADNNPGNSAGITTANATCNTNYCCAAQ